MLIGMDALRLGQQFRALRLRQNLRQLDVGRLARLSRPVISRIDRGLVGNIQIDELDRAAFTVWLPATRTPAVTAPICPRNRRECSCRERMSDDEETRRTWFG